MKPFAYARAASVADAVALGAEVSTTYLAGGTNLVDHLRLGIARPDRIVDINRLDLGGVDITSDGGLRIGANVRNSDLAADPELRQRFPFVCEALVAGASGQLRNMASTGGNLLQRTRCVYFQDLAAPCNKRDPGTGCSAIEGFGKYNAILGASPACVAVHPSDLCIPLAALDTVVHLTGPAGDRTLPFADLHRLPGQTPDRETNLEPGELITAVEIGPLAYAHRSRYRKVRERASYAFATVSIAAALDLDSGTVRDVRLGLGGVSHRPHRARVAEEALRGRPATAESFAAAIDAELESATTGPGNRYKIPQIRNTFVAVLTDLAAEGTR